VEKNVCSATEINKLLFENYLQREISMINKLLFKKHLQREISMEVVPPFLHQ
jgi:hypothetical protein